MKPTLIIPMAGDGQRFIDAGYKDPKPMIEFLGKKMIQHVVDAFPIEANIIFIIRKEHDEMYSVQKLLSDLYPSCTIISIDKKTEGSACTVLLAKPYVADDVPLFIMNSDNIIHWSFPENFIDDGFILTFEDDNPKWSFAKIEDGYVTEVAEKNPISTHATSGIYYWKKAKYFFDAVEEMISENFRVNNEFYTAPVYNWNINAGQKIKIYPSVMQGVGTPEDLENYIAQYTSTS